MTDKTFTDKLAQLRSRFCDQLPTPEVAVLARATARLRRSGILSDSLQTGETVPDFEFIAQCGGKRRLYQLLEQGPVVLNFFRGFWCSWCKTELEAYREIHADLAGIGVSYLAISPQRIPEQSPLIDGCDVIFDRNNQIARHFGIVYRLEEEEVALFRGWGLDLLAVNDTAVPELPLPATYLIKQDRSIGYRFVDVDFRERCCPEALIDEIHQLAR
ncbi:MAG: redoxin domain-containing protein [Pseudomonadales bacterium]|nr:redoxin domain-containing protein [Pseudomonadales bacterium]